MKLTTTTLLTAAAVFGQTTLTTAQITKRVSPSVVVIQGNTDSGGVLGSGFIISKDGKIVTNLHVIRDMNSAIIKLATGEVLGSFFVLAVSELRDLAIVQVTPPVGKDIGGGWRLNLDLPALVLGNSDTLTVGEPVVVVGSPRGLEGTVTAGILSSIRDGGDGIKVLQTDAAVNPGNSGGPLVDGKGQAVGVVSFKLRSAEGLNFAVPINYVRDLLNNLHDQWTLAQMRQNLVNTTVQRVAGPSLKETLDWLKEKAALAGVHYILSLASIPMLLGYGRTKEVTDRIIPRHFESCTISFDDSEVWVWEKYRELREVNTTRYAVPLGEISDVSILTPADLPKVPGKPELWSVALITKSNAILKETWTVIVGAGDSDENAPRTTQSESVNAAFMDFTEEATTKRVVQAFKHAADLCRGKEVF